MFDIKAVDGTAFLMEPAALKKYLSIVAAHPGCFTGRQLVREREKRRDKIKAQVAQQVQVQRQMSVAPGAGARGARVVGRIPVVGPLDQHLSVALMKSGGTACDEIDMWLAEFLNNPQVTEILLDVESPGSYSTGIEETSDRLYAARSKKPLYAVANSYACSAAAWLASSATKFAITPGGVTASVGVFCLHIDQSKAMEEEGVTVTLVSAGKYKTELSPYAPLGEEARARLQQEVNFDYKRFLTALAHNRDMTTAAVERDFGQGRTMMAREAVAHGLCDAVRTLEQMMLAPGGGAAGNRALAEWEGRCQAHLGRLRGMARLAADVNGGTRSAPPGPTEEINRLRQEQSRRQALTSVELPAVAIEDD